MIALLKTAKRAGNASYTHNYVYQRHLVAYKQVLQQQLDGAHVLEVGCREGYGIEMIAPYTKQYTAADIHPPDNVSFDGNTAFQQCLLPSLSGIEDNSFDTVICFQLIQQVRDDSRLLLEIKRVLKPGGKLLLTTPNILTSLTCKPFQVAEYTPYEISVLMTTHFDNYQLKGIYGNASVMEYYQENKKSVENIMHYDIFNLQYKLPAFLPKRPYTLLNNLNRLLLLRKTGNTTEHISHEDFFLDTPGDDCLDYFVTAMK